MRRGLITGFAGWAVAFVLFRLWGHVLLGSPAAVQLTFLLGGVVTALLAGLLCRLVCQPGKVARFAAGLAIPGLLLDSACVLAFEAVFPTMPVALAAIFGALMLWGYGLILATILLVGDRLVERA